MVEQQQRQLQQQAVAMQQQAAASAAAAAAERRQMSIVSAAEATTTTPGGGGGGGIELGEWLASPTISRALAIAEETPAFMHRQLGQAGNVVMLLSLSSSIVSQAFAAQTPAHYRSMPTRLLPCPPKPPSCSRIISTSSS